MLISFVVGCSPTSDATKPADINDYFPIEVGSAQLELQLAVHSNEQARGLMFREQIAPRHGMLFVFAAPKQGSFWMRNTSLALDLAYFNAEGLLLELYRLYPYDETPILSQSHEIKFALELEQGQMEALGIKSGDRLNMKALAKALTARGFDAKSLLFH